MNSLSNRKNAIAYLYRENGNSSNDLFQKTQYCLAFQCAPVLTGIKPSNLLIIKNKICERARVEILTADANFRLLYSADNKYIYLVYRKNSLFHTLSKSASANYLADVGYQKLNDLSDMEDMFNRLSLRFRAALNQGGEFPHEIGIFMGYPVEDVEDFVRNRGKNYQISGYWKVYHRKDVASRIFKQYDLARYEAVRHISKGGTLSQLTSVYAGAYRNMVHSC